MSPSTHRAPAEQAGYISVDVETAGPNPAQYSLLSIGACLVLDPTIAFYVELRPVQMNATAEALAVCKLSLEQLALHGTPPAEAMVSFERWLKDNVPAEVPPLFCGFNSPFDWMFVNDYFHRYLGRNPFGHAALDIKSYYMGLKRVSWSDTSMYRLAAEYMNGAQLSHNAVRDAQDQARLFRNLLEEASRTRSGS